MIGKALPYVLGAILLGGALVIAAWPGPSNPDSIAPKVSPVRVEPVTRSDHHRVARFSGVARASQRAHLAFSLPGRLANRRVDLGDHVSPGQVLAQLEDREFRNAAAASDSALVELQTRLDQAERDLLRVTQLAEAKAATEEEVEKTKTATQALRAAVTAAKIRLEEARRVVAESRLVAPFGGTVAAVHVEPGEWAAPGIGILDIAGTDGIEVEIEVPERVISQLQHDREVLVTLPLGHAQTTGRISHETRAALGSGALFPVVVRLAPQADLVPGSTVDVYLPLADEEVLTLPVDAVLNPGSSRPSVFCVRSGRAEEIPIKLGSFMGNRVAVAADLTVGDSIVVTGHTALTDGMPVEVLP